VAKKKHSYVKLSKYKCNNTFSLNYYCSKTHKKNKCLKTLHWVCTSFYFSTLFKSIRCTPFSQGQIVFRQKTVATSAFCTSGIYIYIYIHTHTHTHTQYINMCSCTVSPIPMHVEWMVSKYVFTRRTSPFYTPFHQMCDSKLSQCNSSDITQHVWLSTLKKKC